MTRTGSSKSPLQSRDSTPSGLLSAPGPRGVDGGGKGPSVEQCRGPHPTENTHSPVEDTHGHTEAHVPMENTHGHTEDMHGHAEAHIPRRTCTVPRRSCTIPLGGGTRTQPDPCGDRGGRPAAGRAWSRREHCGRTFVFHGCCVFAKAPAVLGRHGVRGPEAATPVV